MSDDKTAQEIARLAAELNDLAKGNVQFDQGHTTTEIRERARQIVYATRDPEARWEEYMIWVCL